MFSRQTIKEIEGAAREEGLEPAALLAIADVESGGRAFAMINGRKEPLIRFEGHYFDRLLDDADRQRARAKGLASPRAGAVKNPASQAARWKLLGEAMALDRAAALQSVSWGIGQVMGSHWCDLGYGSVDSLAAEARSGVAGQIALMIRFLKKNGLGKLLKARDWAGFARRYNGPQFRRNRYDSRMAAAYARYAGGEKTPPPVSPLRRGARGAGVLELQRSLTAAGYPLTQDGRFGPATARAVERFQRDQGLPADGIAGPATMAALREAPGENAVPSLTGRVAGIAGDIGRFLQRLRIRWAGRTG
ncbi:N-acetylmuramidase domain-containing protein [Oricola cellulosilytica]|uniref:DUF3380 domain-containing protein n=1 Tax=Oricola cellulosilytica TaxID=1429082 RepID=A0A4R0P3A5_9HYPH|nr:N-acetylmuramidase domain-containing protein [Oricola cellulosilytica]TCD11342.1 DUF3380 domain-containing protein [Oricola cellulosilytica]